MKPAAAIIGAFGFAGLILSLRTDPPGTPVYVLDAITGSAGTPWMVALLAVAAFIWATASWVESAQRQRNAKQS